MTFYISTQSQGIQKESKKIEYTLPYHGILSDNPLYFIKESRDRILDFLTRDPLKKAELNLLFSDKRVSMSLELSKKRKWNQAAKTLLIAEKYFQKIPAIIVAVNKQGVNPSGDFLERIRLANNKHREIIIDLINDAPQAQKQNLQEALIINKQISKAISSL